jgi:hypothetical protein
VLIPIGHFTRAFPSPRSRSGASPSR